MELSSYHQYSYSNNMVYQESLLDIIASLYEEKNDGPAAVIFGDGTSVREEFQFCANEDEWQIVLY